jgi:hypothetical protein
VHLPGGCSAFTAVDDESVVEGDDADEGRGGMGAAVQLWNAHVLPARTAGSHLDVRQSSYKKLGDFLKAKVKEGLLDTQVDKKTKEAKLVRVNRSHPAYCQYVPSHSTAAAAEAAAAGEEKAKEQLEVISVFKPSHDQLPLFEAMGGTKGNLYTLQEVCLCVCVCGTCGLDPNQSKAFCCRQPA